MQELGRRRFEFPWWATAFAAEEVSPLKQQDCDIYASDLNPIAMLLTGLLNINGSSRMATRVKKFQERSHC